MTGRDIRIRMVLRPQADEGRIHGLSVDLGWVPLGSRPASDTGPYERLWFDEASEVYVHFVWDDLLGLAYLLLHGDDVPAVCRRIETSLPVETYDGVLAALRAAAGRQPVLDAIARLAAFRRPETPEAVELLAARAATDDVEIRRALVTAAGYLEWPGLLALAARMRAEDPDETVRADAALVLDAVAETHHRVE